MANTPGAGIVLPSGKGGVLSSGKGALFNGDGKCPACCWENPPGDGCERCNTGTTPKYFTLTFTDVVKCTSGDDADCPFECIDAALVLLNGTWELEQQPDYPCYYMSEVALTSGCSDWTLQVHIVFQVDHYELEARMYKPLGLPTDGAYLFNAFLAITPPIDCDAIDASSNNIVDSADCDCVGQIPIAAKDGQCAHRAGRAA